nr:ribonuclease H-like domain-containing protein [Tanacetum cinerariifolium]
MIKAIGTVAALGTWQAIYPTFFILSHLMEGMCLLVKEDARLLAREPLKLTLPVISISAALHLPSGSSWNILVGFASYTLEIREPIGGTRVKHLEVLVNKSQNKTPYELLNDRTPAIGFLKPFGCHVMILNTLDNLGKFEAKEDEGYFIGYSMSSKAFRVFNKRTRRVEENLHVQFLENKAIGKGAGPNWLFDIDSLAKSMNYVPVDAVSLMLKEALKFLKAVETPIPLLLHSIPQLIK